MCVGGVFGVFFVIIFFFGGYCVIVVGVGFGCGDEVDIWYGNDVVVLSSLFNSVFWVIFVFSFWIVWLIIWLE